MEGKDQASFQVRPAPLFHIFPSLSPSPVVGSNPALVFSAYRAELLRIETSAQRLAADQICIRVETESLKMAGGEQINSGEGVQEKETEALK